MKKEVTDSILDRVVEFMKGGQKAVDSVIIELTQKQIDHNSNIHIPKEKWYLFPRNSTEIELEHEEQVIKRKFNHKYHEFAMGEWFTAYKLKGGDRVIITPIEVKKNYHVEFFKAMKSGFSKL